MEEFPISGAFSMLSSRAYNSFCMPVADIEIKDALFLYRSRVRIKLLVQMACMLFLLGGGREHISSSKASFL